MISNRHLLSYVSEGQQIQDQGFRQSSVSDDASLPDLEMFTFSKTYPPRTQREMWKVRESGKMSGEEGEMELEREREANGESEQGDTRLNKFSLTSTL